MWKTPEQILDDDSCDWHDMVEYCNSKGEIPEEFKVSEPTLHFCDEWDFDVICDKMPEFESCKCDGGSK